jgi:ParB family chromosome partitioning protein
MNTPTVRQISIGAIRVVNPRLREQKRFNEIVESIAHLGLKRPITVTPAEPENGEERFNLACGQGRLEACCALGAKEIPALVTNCAQTDAVLASLVENIARRRVRPLEQIRLMQWLKDQGNDAAEIARITGLSSQYVGHVLTMLEKGEERLLEGVLHGEIPISLAVRIAEAADGETQSILLETHARKELSQKSLAAFKRILEHRKSFGRQVDRRGNHRGGNGDQGSSKATADSLIAAYKRETQRLRLVVKKGKLCETRLLSLAAAFKVLLADENFTTLLRAEQMETMPRFLAERARRMP